MGESTLNSDRLIFFFWFCSRCSFLTEGTQNVPESVLPLFAFFECFLCTNRDVQVVLATFSCHTSTATALHLRNEGTG